MAKAASPDIEDEQGAERALIDLVCLLAQQAARTYFADNNSANLPPAPVQLEIGENDDNSP